MSLPRQEVLAFIPARGGSKGLAGKNLSLLGGMPLVTHSIHAANLCPVVTRVVVSTDSPDIEAVALEHGGEVPFMRPGSLAGDRVLIADALDHTLKELKQSEGYNPDAVVVLMPTHPFRSVALMRTLGRAVLDGYKRVRTVNRIILRPNTLFSLPVDNESLQNLPIARIRTCYRSYGLFDGFRLTGATKNIYLYELSGPFELVDIDTSEDLALARSLWPAWQELQGRPA